MSVSALQSLDQGAPGVAAVPAGNILVDVARYQASVGNRPVVLTYQEFELLRLLVGRLDRIVPFDELVDGLWHGDPVGTRRRLRVVVCRLRAKLDGAQPYRIETVRARGYGLTVFGREQEAGDFLALAPLRSYYPNADERRTERQERC